MKHGVYPSGKGGKLAHPPDLWLRAVSLGTEYGYRGTTRFEPGERDNSGERRRVN